MEQPRQSQQSRQGDALTYVWKNLVDWVTANEGYVHPSLQLEGNGPSRGIVVRTKPIQKEELLIRMPPKCVISGVHVPSKISSTTAAVADDDDNGTPPQPPASPWLRCVAAYLQAKKFIEEDSQTTSYSPYIQSLPHQNEYETLFQWSNEEILQYLCGTTIGKILLLDRNDKSLEKRYQIGVVPFLQQNLGIAFDRDDQNQKKASSTTTLTSLSMDELIKSDNYQSFLEATMCISTRGFHLTKEEEDSPEKASNNTTSTYNGPFLLPVIDLLNHDPTMACTTLQRDSKSGNFTMIAERPIEISENVVHSYGDTLSSAQLLQTFGFVPYSHTKLILCEEENNNLKKENVQHLTPVCLHKSDHLARACLMVKNSNYPKQLRGQISSDDVEDGDDEVWFVEDIPNRLMKDAMPDEFMVSMNDKQNGYLFSEDMITLLAIQFLPEDAFIEIFSDGDDSSTTIARLDRSILTDDPYLGLLVCHSLLTAISTRSDEYISHNQNKSSGKSSRSSTVDVETTKSQLASMKQDEAATLNRLLSTSPSTKQIEREIYGRTIRVEEMINLHALCKEIESLVSSLNHSIQPTNKRTKLD